MRLNVGFALALATIALGDVLPDLPPDSGPKDLRNRDNRESCGADSERTFKFPPILHFGPAALSNIPRLITTFLGKGNTIYCDNDQGEFCCKGTRVWECMPNTADCCPSGLFCPMMHCGTFSNGTDYCKKDIDTRTFPASSATIFAAATGGGGVGSTGATGKVTPTMTGDGPALTASGKPNSAVRTVKGCVWAALLATVVSVGGALF